MSRISTYILFLSLFLLAACDSAKKEFETLKEGDIYYHSGDGKYYYVDKVNKYDQVPNGSWVPLKQ